MEADNKHIRLAISVIKQTLKYKTQKPSGTDVKEADIPPNMNAQEYLFDQISLTLGMLNVETIQHPGVVIQVKEIIKRGKNYSNLNECYVLDKGNKKAKDDSNTGWKTRKEYYN